MLLVVGVSIAWTYPPRRTGRQALAVPQRPVGVGIPQIAGAARTENLVFQRFGRRRPSSS